jgi:methylated-DNA-[protein]-cysteine S-methyltransferase
VTFRFLDTPVGRLLLARDETGVRQIHFSTGADLRKPVVGADLQVGPWNHDEGAFEDVVAQLTEYFEGRRRQFDLPLAPEGTPFQRRVWNALLDIPYGETISYGQLASRIGQKSASRAVGLANGSNPLPIVIPCHRVIGANGKLTGYGGGLAIKERLLAHERGERRFL